MSSKTSASTTSDPKQVVLHPILCALYPVLFLYGTNAYLYEPSVVLWPGAISVAACLVLWGAGTVLFRNAKSAALLVSIGFLIFTSFGAIFDGIARADLAAQGLGDLGMSYGHMIILSCVGLASLACLLLLKYPKLSYHATYAMNLIGTFLLAVPLISIVQNSFATIAVASRLPASPPSEQSLRVASSEPLPDIYHIVLDGYGRDDVFQEVYGYDNSYFTDFLEDRGFYVAREANANYSQTSTALSSMVNLDYLDTFFGDQLGPISNRRFLRELFGDSRAVRSLRQAGYEIVSYESGYLDVQVREPDVLLRPDSSIHPFDLALLDMTPIPWILGQMGRPPLYDRHRDRITHAFRTLPETAKMDGPKYVYLHILAAHPPFVFNSDGTSKNPNRRFNMMVWGEMDEYLDGYRDQVTYINNQLMETIDLVLENSERPPIIMIHGDHGPGSRLNNGSIENSDLHERMSILNTYLLPGEAKEGLYPSISPVNSYRLIFNEYFGTSYELLEDRSYMSEFRTPYRLIAVDPPASNTTTALR